MSDPGLVMKRILVTGSRELTNIRLVADGLVNEMMRFAGLPVTLVHGDCPRGADYIAASLWPCIMDPVRDQSFWVRNGYPIEAHPANWNNFGKPAGFIRNAEMVKLGADVCLAFFKDGEANKGTTHCSGLAEAAGIRVMRFYEGADRKARVPA